MWGNLLLCQSFLLHDSFSARGVAHVSTSSHHEDYFDDYIIWWSYMMIIYDYGAKLKSSLYFPPQLPTSRFVLSWNPGVEDTEPRQPPEWAGFCNQSEIRNRKRAAFHPLSELTESFWKVRVGFPPRGDAPPNCILGGASPPGGGGEGGDGGGEGEVRRGGEGGGGAGGDADTCLPVLRQFCSKASRLLPPTRNPCMRCHFHNRLLVQV